MMTWARGHSQGAKGPVRHAEAEADSGFPELPAGEGWRLVQRPRGGETQRRRSLSDACGFRRPVLAFEDGTQRTTGWRVPGSLFVLNWSVGDLQYCLFQV